MKGNRPKKNKLPVLTPPPRKGNWLKKVRNLKQLEPPQFKFGGRKK